MRRSKPPKGAKKGGKKINKIFSKKFKKSVDKPKRMCYNNTRRRKNGTREHSSAGRASALQAEGHRFEPYCSHHFGPVVQLVRTLACHARGQGFESPSGRHFFIRSSSCLFASVAQLVEQRTENPRVVGSIPTGGTIFRGFSSFGRAPPCQGGGGGFEPRNPLQTGTKRNFPYPFLFQNFTW